jgi:hypothetical protein
MQSIDILIVIVLIRYRARAWNGDCGRIRISKASGKCLTTWPARPSGIQNDGMQKWIAADEKEKAAPRRKIHATPLLSYRQKRRLLVVFGFQHFTTTIEAVRADVVTQMRFAGGWLDAQLWRDQEVVRTVHAALRRGFLVLLNSHDDS